MITAEALSQTPPSKENVKERKREVKKKTYSKQNIPQLVSVVKDKKNSKK